MIKLIKRLFYRESETKEYEWIDAKQRLPNPHIIVFVLGECNIGTIAHFSHGQWYCIDTRVLSGVTHWLPIPDMPDVFLKNIKRKYDSEKTNVNSEFHYGPDPVILP